MKASSKKDMMRPARQEKEIKLQHLNPPPPNPPIQCCMKAGGMDRARDRNMGFLFSMAGLDLSTLNLGVRGAMARWRTTCALLVLQFNFLHQYSSKG